MAFAFALAPWVKKDDGFLRQELLVTLPSADEEDEKGRRDIGDAAVSRSR